ncbi:hypothetical protein BJ912DRAFT_930819 [Pholiota molesta]|nr:hypothetical protein BJ912DRAFT_930819 [Pholiota molesta]
MSEGASVRHSVMSYVRFPVPSRLTSTTPSSAPSITNCVAICAGRSRIGAPRGALVVRAARAEHAQLRECSGVGVGVAGVVERVQPPRSLPAGPRARASFPLAKAWCSGSLIHRRGRSRRRGVQATSMHPFRACDHIRFLTFGSTSASKLQGHSSLHDCPIICGKQNHSGFNCTIMAVERRVETAAQSVKMARKTGVTQVALELGEELNEDLACCTEG